MKPLIDQVLDYLASTKRQWPEVSRATGVPYSTLTKIYQRVNRDPRISTVQRILDHRNTLDGRVALTNTGTDVARLS